MKNRKPTRLQGFDYSLHRLYFITSCVQDRICCLGNVINGKMELNEYGKICEQQWHWLPEQYAYVILHAFCVMPNHIHGIIEIDSARVGNGRDHSLHAPMKIKSLSELMGAYKNHHIETNTQIGVGNICLAKILSRSHHTPWRFLWKYFPIY